MSYLTTHFTFVQFVGFVAMAVMISAYAMKSDRRLNQIFIVSNSLWVLHYILLGATAGAVNCTVNVLRSTLAIQLNNRKWRIPIFFAACLIYSAVTYATYKSPLDLLPLLASYLTCIAFYLVRPGIESRFFILLSCLAWTIYSFSVHSVSGTIAFALSAIMTLIVILRLKSKQP